MLGAYAVAVWAKLIFTGLYFGNTAYPFHHISSAVPNNIAKMTVLRAVLFHIDIAAAFYQHCTHTFKADRTYAICVSDGLRRFLHLSSRVFSTSDMEVGFSKNICSAGFSYIFRKDNFNDTSHFLSFRGVYLEYLCVAGKARLDHCDMECMS